MARTLEFDVDNALNKAMRLFWKSGYARTSLRDLLKAMGIGEGSFYNSLKSKKHAYLECLKRFNATIGRERGEAFMTPPTAALGIRALFRCVLDCLDDPRAPSRLCLMSGSISRDVFVEPELRKYVQAQLAELGDAMIARLTADKEAGLLPVNFEPQIVAPVIVTYLQGLFRMALLSYDRCKFERQIDAFLKGLGL
jgi:TetR/AcrR family transcriptional regulator, transcriptional repressor for nem operon